MNPRERVLAILNHEKPDVLPWFADLAYWIDYLNDENLMPEKYKGNDDNLLKENIISQGLAKPFVGKGLYQLHEDLGVGFYLQGYFPFTEKYEGVKIEEEYRGNSRITTIETPYGNLREIWNYEITSHSWGPKEFAVKDWRDLKKLRYLYEGTHYEPDYTLAEYRCKMIKDTGLGVVLCYLPKSPMMELVALRAGIQTFTYMWAEAVVDELEETLAIMEKKHDKAAEIALNSPAECLMIPENILSEMIGKTFYILYMKSYEEKWIKRIKQKNKYSFVHLDGTMKGLITELSEAGFDVIEAITPFPVGDITIDDVHNYVNDMTIIWGGIPGGFFVELSDAEFDKYVIHAIEVMKKEPRYVLGVGDQVVPGATFERIQHVGKLVEKYGKF
jgi:hypothetical protein